MININAIDFISMLSEDLPVMCLFSSTSEKEQVKKIVEVINKIEKKLPKLKTFHMVVDENDKNAELCEVTEVIKTPTLIIYKNGCFSRYKDRNFTEIEIMKFLGNTKIYQKINKEITEDFTV